MEEQEINIKSKKKGTFYRNVWLLSILLFIVGLFFGLFDIANGGSYLFGVILIGASSFIFWLLSMLLNKFLASNQRAISLLQVGIQIIFGLIVTYALIYALLFRFVQIGGSSMMGYQDGSYHPLCLICKDFKRGDVVFYKNSKNNVDYIGRIVGMPNESIDIEKGRTLANEQKLQEDNTDWSQWSQDIKIRTTLNNDEYLILVDKRWTDANSEDFIKDYVVNKSYVVGKFLK